MTILRRISAIKYQWYTRAVPLFENLEEVALVVGPQQACVAQRLCEAFQIGCIEDFRIPAEQHPRCRFRTFVFVAL